MRVRIFTLRLETIKKSRAGVARRLEMGTTRIDLSFVLSLGMTRNWGQSPKSDGSTPLHIFAFLTGLQARGDFSLFMCLFF